MNSKKNPSHDDGAPKIWQVLVGLDLMSSLKHAQVH